MENVNIIGVGGFIGSHLYRYLQPFFRVSGSYFTRRQENHNIFLDITDINSIREVLLKFNHSTIILLSGLKDVAECEENPRRAYQLNTLPVKEITEITEQEGLDIRLLYFSSDYVFDGRGGNYRPDSPLNPWTNYGRSKKEAEISLSQSRLDYKIIRTSSVMGQGSVFLGWLLEQLRREGEIPLFGNVMFTPTPVNFLCEMIAAIIRQYPQINERILHVTGEKKCSRFEFGQQVQALCHQSPAMLKSVDKDLSQGTFHADLSMLQSEFVRQNQTRAFHEYLAQAARELILP